MDRTTLFDDWVQREYVKSCQHTLIEDFESTREVTWLTDARPDDLVVKRINPQANDCDYGLIHELEVSRHLRHPNVVEVVAYADGLVMPRAKHDLSELLGSEDTDYLTRVLTDVLTGLAYVYDSGYIHRDLKPRNVLIYDEGARLADFRVSIRAAMRPLDIMVTTTKYCAPEQVRYQYDYAVDLWSFGCLLFEVICKGRALFDIDKFFYPVRDLLTAILACPCIKATDHELAATAGLHLSDEEGAEMIAKRPPLVTWTEYISELGYLDRAVAMTGGVDQLEFLLGGLLSFRPDARLTIDQLRRTPMFSKMSPATWPIAPRLAWDEKTSRAGLEKILPRVIAIMRNDWTSEPRHLRLLFVANCVYSMALKTVNAPRPQLYVASLIVAYHAHDLDFPLGKFFNVIDCCPADIYKLSRSVLMTCLGRIDQETAYDRSPRMTYSKEIFSLYRSNFTD